mgnify:CR=1 FL=1
MSRFYVFHNAKKVITAKVWQNSVFSCALVILFRFCVVFRFFAAGAVSALHFPVQHQAAREKNAGWRIDYFIVSNRIADKIKAAEIHNEVFGSDHCPVELDIDL